jgi:hypothetical protein
MGLTASRFFFFALSITVLVLATRCASSNQETLAQRLAAERWERCRDIAGVTLKEIRPDGQIVVWVTGARDKAWQDCERRVAAEQAAAGRAAPADQTFTIAAPLWTHGDEWAYRWEDGSGGGTFVWVVDRTVTVGGVEYYVVRAAARELYYRADDRALVSETLDGRVVIRYVPAWLPVAWPLSIGKAWDTRYTENKVADRQTRDVHSTCRAESQENVTVPAGRFRTILVVCRNFRDRTVVSRRWYATHVGQFVREESGARVRELIAYKFGGVTAGRSLPPSDIIRVADETARVLERDDAAERRRGARPVQLPAEYGRPPTIDRLKLDGEPWWDRTTDPLINVPTVGKVCAFAQRLQLK